MSALADLVSPELAQQWVVSKKADVLGVIVCFVLTLALLLGLPWVYTFENTQTPEQHTAGYYMFISTHAFNIYVVHQTLLAELPSNSKALNIHVTSCKLSAASVS